MTAYTLPQLAGALGLELSPTAHPVIVRALPANEQDAKQAAIAAGRKGHRIRWQHTLTDFLTLLRLRGGGFDAGCRHKGGFYLARVLVGAGMDDAAVLAHLSTFAAKCRPPLTERDVLDAVRQAKRPRKGQHVSHQRLSLELGVTDTEASYLQHWVPPAAPVQPRRATPDERRAAIVQLVSQLGHVPPTRNMAAWLNARGIEGNFTTVALDYRALGLTPEKPQGGRPPKLPFVG
jgi:hypothetical protein